MEVGVGPYLAMLKRAILGSVLSRGIHSAQETLNGVGIELKT